MMIYGLIPQELHQQLLDQQNYQSRTSGVEELKMLLLELDLQQLPSTCIADFIQFLRRLLDDNNFKVGMQRFGSFGRGWSFQKTIGALLSAH